MCKSSPSLKELKWAQLSGLSLRAADLPDVPQEKTPNASFNDFNDYSNSVLTVSLSLIISKWPWCYFAVTNLAVWLQEQSQQNLQSALSDYLLSSKLAHHTTKGSADTCGHKHCLAVMLAQV